MRLRHSNGISIVTPHALHALTCVCVAVSSFATSACESTAAPLAPSAPVGRAFSAADTLFRRDQRWLGGDAALTIPLSAGRTLWLFGDSFVSVVEPPARNTARLPRNTIAIQVGDDPLTATMSFAWGQSQGVTPTSFFPDAGGRWYWPGHGIRLSEGPLVVFLTTVRSTPGVGLGFAVAGYALALIDNPDAAPSAWRVRIIDGPSLPFDAIPATAVVRDGDQIVALAVPTLGAKRGLLVRYPSAALARGDLSTAQWWAGATRGWIAAAAVGTGGPSSVMDDAGAECSLHWDAQRNVFVHVASYGFGASTIGMRTATALTGPWSAPVTVYRPPESDAAQPFVYAAKAHPTLTGPSGDLLVTYIANSLQFNDLLTASGQRALYWPRMVAVHFGK